MHFTLIEGHLPKKAVVRSRQRANFPRSNPSHISGRHRIAGWSTNPLREMNG
jgi:hypothetical protein